MFLGLCLPLLCITYIKDKKSVKAFIYIGITALFLSSLVAIFQKYIGEPFISLPALLGKVDLGRHYIHIRSGRYSGFTGSSLKLSYDIVNILPLLLSGILIGLNRKKLINTERIILVAVSATLLYAQVLTGTRSAFYGLLLSLLIVTFFIGFKDRKLFYKISSKLLIFGLVILLLGIALNISQIRSFSRIKGFADRSALSKIPKFVSGIKASKEALIFGTGSVFVDPLESLEEIPSVFNKYTQGLGGGNVHNIFINNLLLGGVPRLILLVMFLSVTIIAIYFMLAKILRDPSKKDYLMYFFGYAIWIIAYIIDKLVHNTDPFNDLVFWYILGSFMALTYILRKDRSDDAGERP
jgi:O-antigen ligase